MISKLYHSTDKAAAECTSTVSSVPHKFELIIPDSSKTILHECRENAMAAGILRDEFKIKVPATLIFNNDTVQVRLRLKGDYSDHWSGSKWSYRIYTKKQKHIFGMRSFSIQSPETRGILSEWYFHALLREEGLIALRNKYVSLEENGEEKGIYLVEESFDKQLLENNGRRESPILKFDESIWIDRKKVNEANSFSQEDIFLMAKIDMFKSKSVLKTPLLLGQYNKARVLIDKLKKGDNKLKELVDIDKAAQLFAIADLTGGHHALRWKNVRFYYNPLLGKLELVGFDSNSGRVITDIYYNQWRQHKIGGFDVFYWKNIFFQDSEFVTLYIEHLRRLSDPSFLEDFNLKVSPQLDTNTFCVCQDYPSHEFQLANYQKNAELIREKLAKYDLAENGIQNKYSISAKASSIIKPNDKTINVSVTNSSRKEISVYGVFNKKKKLISEEYNLKVGKREFGQVAANEELVFNLAAPLDSAKARLKRKGTRWVQKGLKIGYSYSDNMLDTFYTRIETFYKNNFSIPSEPNLSSEIFAIDHDNKKVEILAGNWTFDKDIVTPAGYTISCSSNTHLTLNNSAAFVSNGKINFVGTKDNPITVDSKDGTGSFFVCQADGVSNLANVVFDNLSDNKHNRWHVTGSVCFYESDMKMENVTISNNNCEDALNVVLSEFTILNCQFQNIYSDAFDGDFSKGKVSNCSFKTVGNDALDFSGSTILLDKISIQHLGDKGISAGERSTISGTDITMDSVEIALVSKDHSKLSLDQVNISKATVPYVVFQKKPEYGPGELSFTNYVEKDVQESPLIESRSKVTVNDKNIAPNSENVKSVLYGNLYGKKSG
ncbi:MAG: hypothetical protein GY810_20470 [Aureispira sp.]|nr:hypothetical protein [Aureispira sp.]